MLVAAIAVRIPRRRCVGRTVTAATARGGQRGAARDRELGAQERNVPQAVASSFAIRHGRPDPLERLRDGRRVPGRSKNAVLIVDGRPELLRRGVPDLDPREGRF